MKIKTFSWIEHKLFNHINL